MIKNYNNEQTNKAWKQLHTRLEQDGLICETRTTRKKFLATSTMRWVASLIIICIGTAILFLLVKDREPHAQLLSLNNQSNTSALVSTLEDGSIVYLAQQTSLHFPEHFEASQRKVFLQGNALFDVSGNKQRPFIIETEQAIIEVIGTSFDVKSAGEFSLSVLSGKVKITSKNNNQSMVIEPGETGSFNAGQLQKSLTTKTNLLQNYIHEMQFKDEPLANIVHVVNKNSVGMQLKISSDLADKLLTVTFSGDSPQTVAQLICAALNLKYTQQQNIIYISAD